MRWGNEIICAPQLDVVPEAQCFRIVVGRGSGRRRITVILDLVGGDGDDLQLKRNSMTVLSALNKESDS